MKNRFEKKFNSLYGINVSVLNEEPVMMGNPPIADLLAFIELEIELAVTKERKRMSDWASKNYSRSAAPLYAHVDVVELIENINTK